MMLELMPHLLGYVLSGGLLALPGACADLLLSSFGWSAADFGMAITLQGVCAFIGSRWAAKRAVPGKLKIQSRKTLLCGCAGLLLYYFAEWTVLPLLGPVFPPSFHQQLLLSGRVVGIVALGFSVGANGIFNNTAGMQLPQRTRALNVLNLAFTVGAMLVPLAATAYLNLVVRPQNPSPFWGMIWWRLPAAALIICYLLVLVFAFGRNSKTQGNAGGPERPQNKKGIYSFDEGKDEEKFRDWRPAALIALLLFCYVGSEVNVSNGMALLNWKAFGFEQQQARIASPVFWSGLFLARLTASLANFRVESFGRILLSVSLGTLACFLLLLFQAFRIFPDPYLANLVLVFATGLCIGSIYGFALGATTYFYSHAQANKNANSGALAGVAGSVLLPLFFGQVAARVSLYGAGILVASFMTIMATASLGIAVAISKREASVHKSAV